MGECHLYVVKWLSYIKIGITEQPESRLTALSMNLPADRDHFEVVAVIPGLTVKTEKALLHRFSPHQSNGEWFKIEGVVSQFLLAMYQADDADDIRAVLEAFGCWRGEAGRNEGMYFSLIIEAPPDQREGLRRPLPPLSCEYLREQMQRFHPLWQSSALKAIPASPESAPVPTSVGKQSAWDFEMERKEQTA